MKAYFDAPDSLNAALAAIERAHDEASCVRAAEILLDAVGNNHAGTYCPLVLAAVERTTEILQGSNAWSQRAVLEALIDLCGSFEPDQAYMQYEGTSLATILHSRVVAIGPQIKAISIGTSPAAASASDLLGVL